MNAGRGNGGDVDGMATAGTVGVRAEMETYDGLPPEVRELLANAPWKLSAEAAADHVFRVGPKRVVRDYKKAFAKLAAEGRTP